MRRCYKERRGWMFDRTTINIEIFKDTEQRYRTKENLKEAVKNYSKYQLDDV